MTLARGFKTEAEWYAENVRRELGVGPANPLDPWALAKHLDHEVCYLSAFADQHPREVACLQQATGARGFSALLLHAGSARLILLNDRHARTRQAADLAHELAHALLLHEPLPLERSQGVRRYDGKAEKEAEWLGATLLVPRPAVAKIIAAGWPVETAARQYGVSVDLMQMRLNKTGARKRVPRGGSRR